MERLRVETLRASLRIRAIIGRFGLLLVVCNYGVGEKKSNLITGTRKKGIEVWKANRSSYVPYSTIACSPIIALKNQSQTLPDIRQASQSVHHQQFIFTNLSTNKMVRLHAPLAVHPFANVASTVLIVKARNNANHF